MASPITLFDSRGTKAGPQCPTLLGGVCEDCGYLFFPFQSYGCEQCGSTQLAKRHLIGRGRLVTFATVHAPIHAEVLVPFAVGSVELVEGVIVRSLLHADCIGRVNIGDPMIATVLFKESFSSEKQELRFSLVSEVQA